MHAGNGRNASFKRENGANHVTRGSRTALPATNKASNNNITVPNEIKYVFISFFCVSKIMDAFHFSSIRFLSII